MNIFFTWDARKELDKLISEDLTNGGRLLEDLLDIFKNGHKAKGHSKPLRGNFSGWWSRRLTKKHRLMYQIEEDGLIVVGACYGHYDD